MSEAGSTAATRRIAAVGDAHVPGVSSDPVGESFAVEPREGEEFLARSRHTETTRCRNGSILVRKRRSTAP
jgi:hypothetical protein